MAPLILPSSPEEEPLIGPKDHFRMIDVLTTGASDALRLSLFLAKLAADQHKSPGAATAAKFVASLPPDIKGDYKALQATIISNFTEQVWSIEQRVIDKLHSGEYRMQEGEKLYEPSTKLHGTSVA
jgi:hypothetical protein